MTETQTPTISPAQGTYNQLQALTDEFSGLVGDTLLDTYVAQQLLAHMRQLRETARWIQGLAGSKESSTDRQFDDTMASVHHERVVAISENLELIASYFGHLIPGRPRTYFGIPERAKAMREQIRTLGQKLSEIAPDIAALPHAQSLFEIGKAAADQRTSGERSGQARP